MLPPAWTAAAAGPKSGTLGCRRLAEKDHLVAPWPARRAGWPAENTGRAHSVHNRAVEIGFARQHRLPASFFVHKLPRFPPIYISYIGMIVQLCHYVYPILALQSLRLC